jgi:uncharacterized protein
VSDETLLKFPTEFPIKVMGRNEVTFEKLVADTIAIHVDGFDAGSLSVRESNGGKFLAVTAVFTATSKAQVDAVYQSLSRHPSVLMVL